MRLHAWKVGAVLGVLTVAGFALAPTPGLRDLLWQLVVWGTVLAGHIGLRLHRPARTGGWRLLLAALWLFALGTVVEASVWGLATGHPLMVAGDVIHLVGVLLTGLGSLAFVRALVPGGARDALVDGGIVLTALATVLWGVVVDTTILADHAEPMQYAALVALCVMPAWVMAMALRVLTVAGWQVRSAALMCAAGATSLAAAVSTSLALQDGHGSGVGTSLLWLAGFVLVVTAVLHPTMRRLTEPLADPETAVTSARVSMLGLALLAPPMALFVASDGRLGLAVVASAGLSLGIWWRFGSIVAEREEARRGGALRADRQAELASLAELALTGPPLTHMSAAVKLAVEGQISGVACHVRMAGEEEGGDRGYLRIPVIGGQAEHGRLLLAVRRVLTDEEVRYASTVASILAGLLDRHGMDAALHRRALHDDLTGLPNRALLMDRLGHALERGRRWGTSVAVLFIDIDGFKEVNDTRGHASGDALLQGVAARLELSVRTADTLARFAGDEFAIIVEDATADHVRSLAGRIVAGLREPFHLDDTEVPISASVGIAFADERTIDADALILHADWAMYRAKELGRDRTIEFDSTLRDALSRRQRIERDLRGAADRGELRLVYQPFVALDRGADREPVDVVVAAEALLRWDHPDLGPVSPGEFIPLAEATAAIVAIGEWVLRHACADLAAWRAALPPSSPFSVFVNVSPVQLSEPMLVERLDRCLAHTGADPAHLGFEITESAVLDDDDHVTGALLALRAKGVRIALDDFGTGYSSLAHLRRVPLDLLKMDASFVDGLDQRRDDRAIVAAVAGLAQELGVQVLAEGVEQPEQLAAVRALGCDLAQGYLLGRPVPPEQLSTVLGLTPSAGLLAHGPT